MPEKKDNKGILQTASAEQCVINGEIYKVGEKARDFVTKIRAGSEVVYTLKGDTITFCQPTGHKASTKDRTEHTIVSKDQLDAERDAYNEKGKTTPNKFTPKNIPEKQSTIIDKDKLPHICRECVTYIDCTKSWQPDKECIEDVMKEAPINKFAGALDDKTADEMTAKRTKTYDKQITEVAPVEGSVGITIHISMGSYSHFELSVQGSDGDHARALLLQEANKTVPIVKTLMREAMKFSQEVRY